MKEVRSGTFSLPPPDDDMSGASGNDKNVAAAQSWSPHALNNFASNATNTEVYDSSGLRPALIIGGFE